MQINVWKIGSKWGDSEIDLLPFFRECNIAFFGGDEKNEIEKVQPSDLVAITKGQKIVAIGKVKSNGHALADFTFTTVDVNELGIDPKDIKVLQFEELYFEEEVGLEFGSYGGVKRFHKASEEYARYIIDIFNKVKKK